MSEIADDYGILETTRSSFVRSGETLEIDEAEYRLVPPLERGTTFDGAWRYFFASSGMTATNSGGISVERMLILSKDGKFRRTGATGYMSSIEGADATTSIVGNSDKPLQSGGYEVDGYRMTVIGDDGRKETMSIFRPDADDELLVIDGENYLKQD